MLLMRHCEGEGEKYFSGNNGIPFEILIATSIRLKVIKSDNYRLVNGHSSEYFS